MRASNDISHDSKLRFTASSVINKMTQITVALGSTTVLVGTLIDAKRLRLPLLSGSQSTVGFLSLSSWSLKSANRGASTENTPSKLALQNYDQVRHKLNYLIYCMFSPNLHLGSFVTFFNVTKW